MQLADVAPPASPPFDRVAGLFDDTWYGDRPATDADVAEVERLEVEVLQLTARVPTAARVVSDQPPDPGRPPTLVDA